MQVSCLFGRESYHAGGILVARFRVSNAPSRRDCVLLAQASGYVTFDPKWVRSSDSSSGCFILPPGVDQNIHMPLANTPNTHCVFITPREVLSMTQMNEDGVFIMFTLPNNLIPTYKGLSGTVTYSILLTLQSQGDDVKQMKFGFAVLSGGSAAIPYEIKFSNLAVFGASSIPIENPLLPQYVNDSDDENNNPLLSKNIGSSVIPIDGVVYNIRDKDLICALSMISRGESLFPGSSITISLNFDGCVQPCRFVRAYLHQCENRIDGSRVQDKTLVEASRSADGADLIYLRLHLPDNMACTFSCPVFKVGYFIVLEFFLDDSTNVTKTQQVKKINNKGNDSNCGNDDNNYYANNNWNKSECEPFTWSLPLDINVQKYSIDVAAELSACLDPSAEYVQMFG